MNSHVAYLKSGPQCLSRKEFNAKKETFLIIARVEKPQYKRRKRGIEDMEKTYNIRKKKREEAAPRGTKEGQRQNY